jgi:hypothetical protein
MRTGPNDAFDPIALISDMTDPNLAGVEAGGDLTFDSQSGAKTYWEHTLGDDAALQAIENVPVGFTVEALVDPNGHTLSVDSAAFELADNGDVGALAFTDEVLLVVKRTSAGRQLLHVAGENYGNGA